MLTLTLMTLAALAQSDLGTNILPATVAYPNGFGSPTVWYTGAGYRMHADAELPFGSVPGCAVAYSVVRSDSADGVTWGAPTLVQGPGIRTPCGARQPGGVLLDNGRWAVAFQDVSTGAIGIRGNIWTGAVSTVITTVVGEEPSLVRYGASGAGGALREWSLFVQDYGSLDVEEWNTPGNAGNWSTWAFRGTLPIPGSLSFAADGAYSPVFSCIDGDATWPFTTAFAGEAAGVAGWTYGVVRDNRDVYTTRIGGLDSWPVGDVGQWLSFDTLDDLIDVGVWYEAPEGQINVAAVGGGTLPGPTAAGRDCRP